MEAFLSYLEDTSISEWIVSSDWGYPIMLSIHSIGLAMVVGITVMMDLRILGVAKAVPLSGFSRLVIFAWIGFVINATSGILLYMADARLLTVNWPFLVKMVAVAVGALTFYYITRELKLRSYAKKNGEAALPEPRVTIRARRLAIASMVAWVLGIDSGRLIAYVIDAARLGG